MSMNFVNEPTRAWDPKNRLREMINEGSDAANVDKLVELLIDDGFDFSLTAKLFEKTGFKNVHIEKDLNDMLRDVTGTKPHSLAFSGIA